MIIIGIIVSLILFSVIVIIHELGHFTAARKFGVKVEEFGLGIPPRAKKLFRDKKGTLFSLNWLPIGGFVKLTGEMPNTFLVFDKNKKLYNNEDLEKDIKDNKDIFDKDGNKIAKFELDEILKKLEENNADYNLANKPSWQQAIIILAGVFMNFILAWFIFSILFFVGIKPIGINDKIDTDLDLKIIPTKEQAIKDGIIIKNPGVVLYPIEGSVAEGAGISNDDILNKINGIEVNNPIEVINILSSNKSKEVIFEIKSGNCEQKEPFDPNSMILFCDKKISIIIPKEGKIGSYLGENIEINQDFKYKYGIVGSVKYGAIETKNQILLTFKGLSILVKKIFNPETPEERQEAVDNLSGPIGIVDFISSSISAGVIFILVIGAIISINLGVFNLLPIPALDGGRFIFITVNGLIKKIFGKKIVSEKTEGLIHIGFFILLIALSLIIAYNDLNKIFSN